MFRSRPKLIISAAVFIMALIGLEAYLHLAGFGSYPIYELDNQLKYIPAANQNGEFLNRNHWFFNNRNMGDADNWTPDKHPSVLLLGNSIVLGGNPFDQPDKLGPRLEQALGGKYAVWSAAAGGWTNINEMAYLDRNQDVLQNSDIVVIEYMAGGLSVTAPWPGYYVFPDHRPLLLSSYIFGKYVLPHLKGRKPLNESGALPPVGQTDPRELTRFTNLLSGLTKSSRVVIFFYPTKAYLNNQAAWQDAIDPVARICKSLALTCVDVAREPLWNASMYRDDRVHPTVEGNKRLARILAGAISRDLAQKQG